MKTLDYTGAVRYGIIGLLLAFAQPVFLPVISAQDKTPPKPKEPSSTLHMPNPVTVKPLQGSATLPEGVQHGYAVDVADRILTGNVDIKGRVTALESGRLVFATDKQQTGHLVYRLPRGMTLKLKTNDDFSLTRTMTGRGASLGYGLLLTGGKDLTLASGRVNGDIPNNITIVAGLTLRQAQDRSKKAAEGRYETTYNAPVTLVSDGQAKRLTTGEPTEFAFKGKTYLVMIRESSEIVPTKEKEASSEGQGFTLEYAITLK